MASGISTIFLSGKPKEFCDKLKALLQKIQAGNISNLINDEIDAIFDNLLEYE